MVQSLRDTTVSKFTEQSAEILLEKESWESNRSHNARVHFFFVNKYYCAIHQNLILVHFRFIR